MLEGGNVININIFWIMLRSKLSNYQKKDQVEVINPDILNIRQIIYSVKREIGNHFNNIKDYDQGNSRDE